MPISVPVLAIAFLGTGVLFFALLYTPLTRPDTPGSAAFAITMIGCAMWAVSLSVGLLFDSETITALSWSGRLVAPTVLTAGWFLLAVRIAKGRQPPRWIVSILVGYISIELILLATNSIHQVAFDPSVVAGALGLTPDWNTWFWIQASINYFFMGSATLILATEAIRTHGLRRRQCALLATATVPTAVVNISTITGIIDVAHDLSPFGLAGSALILFVAIYRAEFLDIVPIARETALEELPHAVVTLGRDGRVVDYNAVAREYFTVEQGIGVPAREFFAALPEEAITAIETEEVNHFQTGFEDDEGGRRFDCTASALGPPEENAGRVIVFSEITERIRREQRLLEQGETLAEFANIVSHDIQGPMMELRSTARTAVRTDDTSHVEQVLEAADRMDNLVDDMVELAQSGRQIDDPTPVSLQSVANRAWQSIWTPNATLAIETNQRIAADPDRLQQLLENCFRNAIEHGSSDSVPDADVSQFTSGRQVSPDTATEESATVTVTLRALPTGFAIDDDGKGIPPEEQVRVFARGYTSTTDGTGLGLAIVEQIAAAHGWQITAESSPSGGARIALTDVIVLEE